MWNVTERDDGQGEWRQTHGRGQRGQRGGEITRALRGAVNVRHDDDIQTRDATILQENNRLAYAIHDACGQEALGRDDTRGIDGVTKTLEGIAVSCIKFHGLNRD